MLNKSQIKKWAGATVYKRGQSIYYADEVLEFVTGKAQGIQYINAVVKGSGTKTYLVEFSYDPEEGAVDEIECECPAFHSYRGICKHCVAALLDAESRLTKQQAMDDYLRNKEASLEKLKGLKGAYPKSAHMKKRETNPLVRELLAKRQIVRALPVTQESAFGSVRLEPHVSYTGHEFKLEFKIGIAHMYVLKDLFGFARKCQNRENHVYGKKLQFVHTKDMFEAGSRPLLDFILNWCRDNLEHYRPNYYGYHGYEPPKIKSIQMDNSTNLEAFIDAVEGLSFQADIRGMKEKSWEVTSQPIKWEVEIKGKTDGIWVKSKARLGFVGTKHYLYFDHGMVYRVPKAEVEPIIDFLTCVRDLPNEGAFIQADDVPVFCRELLPQIETFSECTKVDFDEHDYGIIPVSFEIYLDAPQEEFITCKLMAVYGETKYNVYDRTYEIEKRDLTGEAVAQKIISAYFNAYDADERKLVLANDEARVYELLIDGITQLQQVGEVFISEELKKVNVASAPKVTVGVSLSGDLLELSMTVAEMSKEQLLDILSKYDKKKKYYRLKNGDFVNMEDDGIQSLLELKQGLGITSTQLQEDTLTLPKYRALYLDAELKEGRALLAVKNKAFKSLIRNMKTVEDNDFEIPVSLESILREYQKQGYLWIKTLKHNGFGGILADDMGLGKTLQVITLLTEEYVSADAEEKAPSLIVTPASLVYNWFREIQIFSPNLLVKMVVGNGEERKNVLKSIGNGEIVITSYDLLKRDIEYYEGLKFDTQIIDEAQFIKNQNTQASKAVKEISAVFKLALTGTPVENKLSELWSIFDYLMPGFFGAYSRFREELEQPIVQESDEKAMRRLQKQIRPFVLRRLKKEVLTDLPDKIERNYYADMEGEQKNLYNAHVKRMQLMLNKQTDEEFRQGKIQILSELTRLRQICCDPGLLFENYKEDSAKMQMCMELVSNAIGSGHKILIFSQFTTMLEKLQARMAAEKITYYSLTGATSKEKRAKLVERFNQDDTQVFCISLKAGGTGLNLTAADIVIHYDPWWNIAVQNQATDRAHRIGQKNVVTVYKLIVKGTIEEKIRELQERKQELADEILNGEGMSASNFTKDELLELLQ